MIILWASRETRDHGLAPFFFWLKGIIIKKTKTKKPKTPNQKTWLEVIQESLGFSFLMALQELWVSYDWNLVPPRLWPLCDCHVHLEDRRGQGWSCCFLHSLHSRWPSSLPSDPQGTTGPPLSDPHAFPHQGEDGLGHSTALFLWAVIVYICS